MTQFSRNNKSDFFPSSNGIAGNGNGGGNGGAIDDSSTATALGGLASVNPLVRIWNRRWIVLIVVPLSVALAIIHIARATVIYQATARLTVERSGPRVVANDPSESVGQAANYLNTQCEVLRSRKLLTIVASDPEVAEKKTFEGRADEVPDILKGLVQATIVPRQDIINVAVRSQYRDDAADLANRIVDAYKADLESQKKSDAKQVIQFLDKEMTHTETDLDAARKRKLEIQRNDTDLPSGGEHGSPATDRVSRLSAALTDIQLDKLNMQAAYDATKAMANDPQKIRQLLDSRAFKSENADLRRQMHDLQQRYASVGKTYLPNFPDVSALQTALKQIEDELQEEDKNTFNAYVAELQEKLATAQNNETQIQALLNEAKRKAMDVNGRAAEFSIVESEVDSLEKYKDQLSLRIRELSPLSDEAMVNVNIIENALPRDAVAVEPNVASSIYTGLLGGLFVGGLLAFVRDWLDQRMRSIEEIKRLTGLPILGAVPHIRSAKTASARGMILHNDPMSDIAESYRTIRTAVYFGAARDKLQTLLVTSPTPSEGKSTVCSNLGIAMAQAGNRVLILDADFRRPVHHRIFEIDRGIGLSNVLAGNQTIDQAIQHTAVPGLDVLPCGPIPANPSEILNSHLFAEVLHRLTERYDTVVLDSPPLMPVTDARIIAATVDATILVVRAMKTTGRATTFSRDVLRSVGAAVIGVVVNDIPRRKSLAVSYYGDAQMYQYGYGESRKPKKPSSSNGQNGTGETPITPPKPSIVKS